MKREVASSLVERGVAERVRLTQAYEKKKAELQKQHDTVKSQLNDHKDKVVVDSVRFFFYPCFIRSLENQNGNTKKKISNRSKSIEGRMNTIFSI